MVMHIIILYCPLYCNYLIIKIICNLLDIIIIQYKYFLTNRYEAYKQKPKYLSLSYIIDIMDNGLFNIVGEGLLWLNLKERKTV